MSAAAIRPLEHTSDSANIAYYREKGATPDEPYVWVEVLFSIPFRRAEGGHLEHDPTRPNAHHVRVRRNRVGDVVEFTIHRREKGPLSERVVTRLVREAMK